MSYTRINWKDYPKRDTPLSAENLNKMDEGIQSLYNTYLPLSGGLQHKISGTVYLENNDVSFINVNRKAGFRVFNIEDDKNWGQIMLTTDASVNDSERVVMNAYNNSKNGYQCLWMGDSDELTYFFQAGTDGTGAKTTLWKVFDDGHAEVGAMGTTDLSITTKEYVNTNFSKATNLRNGDGSGSVQQGSLTSATGYKSHAEGLYATASGYCSHAEGYGTTASGNHSHAEGQYTIASGVRSQASGYYTNASYSDQTAIGVYNNNKADTLFEVGNGESDTSRSNAFEVYQDGHAEVGAMGTTNLSVVTKQYVDTTDISLSSQILTNRNNITANTTAIQNLESNKVSKTATDFQRDEIIIAADQGTVKGSGVELSELATQQDVSDIYQDIANLSARGMTFALGGFKVGTDAHGNEFLYAPKGSNLIVESSNDNILALINEGGYLQLPHVTYPTTDNDAATKKYVDTAVSACASTTDYGNSIIVGIDSRFIITYQHTIRIGKIIFVHFTFTLATSIDSDIYPFAQIAHSNFYPNHDHGIVICGYNDSMASSSALRTDSAVIKTDGSIWFRAVSSGTSSNFSYDVSCFYSLTDTAFNALN